NIVMEPGRGLLVLTGETGAGKSILIDAISALSGGRTSRDMVRYGQASATVEALFSLSPGQLPADVGQDLGLDEKGRSELILSREISAAGKSVCRINGRLTTLTQLRDVASSLIDIHGQHDQQAIFRVDSHLPLLDRYAGEPVAACLAGYADLLQRYRRCREAMRELGSDPGERARQIDLLSYQTREIAAAAIRPNEDEELTERRRVLGHAEKIREALLESAEILSGDDPSSVMGGIGTVLSRLSAAARLDSSLTDLDEALRSAQDILQTASSDLRAALDAYDADPDELERIDERLDVLHKLKRKYGGSLASVAAFLEKASAQLEKLSGGEARYDQLQAEQARLAAALLASARDLSDKRRAAATGLETKIARELHDLGMAGVRFSVQFADLPGQPSSFPASGLDTVEFLLSANPGEPLRPLARIASGGEASRIMLAIKTILADVDQVPVLIFDEIDTGVSGQTAGKVGEKMMALAQGRQVFCITHMAQIAAMADEHWLIEKQLSGGRTRTELRLLLESERETELARLLSGGVGDQAARQLAVQLRCQAESVRGRPVRS
ncbi:MAG: DNA repair protein RecN, partial [Clostridiaceae bacterium]|nr:DNA repair protein RecN [Clostridiaceae bacterium]